MNEQALDVAIVGAGPAGLSAAIRLARAALNVVVVDEYPVPGGRLLGQLYRHQGKWFVGRDEARRLMEEARTLPIRWLLGTSVHAASRTDAGFILETSADAASVRARAVLVATGSTELPVALPGWHLPGVVTVGAAQTLANVWGVAPGRQGMVVGLSPLGFAISQELRWAGVAVMGLVMAPPAPFTRHLGSPTAQWARLRAWGRAAPLWARAGARILTARAWQRKMIGLWPRSGLLVADIRLRLSVAAVGIEGEEQVEGIRLQRLNGDGHLMGETWVEPVDFVALAGGLRPVPDFFYALGADMVEMPGLGGWVPLTAPDGATTVDGLYAAGNSTGVEGAQVAMAQGEKAALGLLRFLLGVNAVSAVEFAEAAGREAAHRTQAPLEFQEGIQAARAEASRLWDERRSGHRP